MKWLGDALPMISATGGTRAFERSEMPEHSGKAVEDVVGSQTPS